MRFYAIAVPFVALSLAGCQQKPAAAPTVSQADASVAFEGMRRAWESNDSAKVDAVYADDVVGFLPDQARMISGGKAMHEANVAYAAEGNDSVAITDPAYQLLGPDTFVVSGNAHFSNSKEPAKGGDYRFTEVFHKQADGSWKSVTEHISTAPKATAK